MPFDFEAYDAHGAEYTAIPTDQLTLPATREQDDPPTATSNLQNHHDHIAASLQPADSTNATSTTPDQRTAQRQGSTALTTPAVPQRPITPQAQTAPNQCHTMPSVAAALECAPARGADEAPAHTEIDASHLPVAGPAPAPAPEMKQLKRPAWYSQYMPVSTRRAADHPVPYAPSTISQAGHGLRSVSTPEAAFGNEKDELSWSSLELLVGYHDW
ncbi:hypothetical protein NA57DRAFT_74464 [Rhizodiscina lignyota]|uniref:Uncharacterized protein n=1 Tax=Rhizodiscina lignyota TaxID=1504668 RepID=A0A9P4IFY6_9PEZI|nr:hypothetical protein NA57DRAFT_74464 [Rhizodiscina lignyota]